jgi:anti-sigma factor RsiW
MSADLKSDNLITQYLLGKLPEEQQVEIEDRAFSDQEFLASITSVENDLIDEYVRGEMPPADRRQFESRFLASESRRKRVEFAKALAQLLPETRVTERETRKVSVTRSSWRDALAAFINGLSPAGRIALTTATLLLLVGGAWLITQTLTLRRQVTQLQAQLAAEHRGQQNANQNDRQTLEQQVASERRRSEELAAQLNQEKQQRAQSHESLRRLSETVNQQPNEAPRSIIASLTLLPGLSRGATSQPKLILPPNAGVARLQIGIEPEEDYKSFGVELRTASGRPVWMRDSLTARSSRGARSIRLTLPASALLPGEYELRLKGVPAAGPPEDVGFYYFEVMKR